MLAAWNIVSFSGLSANLWWIDSEITLRIFDMLMPENHDNLKRAMITMNDTIISCR